MRVFKWKNKPNGGVQFDVRKQKSVAPIPCCSMTFYWLYKKHLFVIPGTTWVMADPGILGWTHVSTYKYKLGCPPSFQWWIHRIMTLFRRKPLTFNLRLGKGYTANPLYNFRCRCWFRWLPLYPRSWEMVSTAATKQIPIPKRSQGPWSRHLKIFGSWNGKGVWIRFKNIRWIRLVPQSFGVKRKKSLKAPAFFVVSQVIFKKSQIPASKCC